MNKIFTVLFLVIIAFCGVFGFISLDSSTGVVYAAQSYVDSPIEFYTPARRFNQNTISLQPTIQTNENVPETLLFTWSIGSTDSSFEFLIFDNSQGYHDSAGKWECCNGGLSDGGFPTSYSLVRGSWQYLFFAPCGPGGFYYDQLYAMQFYYVCSTGFDFWNIAYIKTSSGSDNTGPYNEIGYYNDNGNYFRIQLKVYVNTNTGNYLSYLYSSNTIYLNSATSGEDYESGYDRGYNRGYSDAFDQLKYGFSTSSYQNGYDDGFGLGYNQGINDANIYSFGHLISAVVDAPVSMFKGLLDFNVLGVNMSQFALSLLTVALTIAILRFILAR